MVKFATSNHVERYTYMNPGKYGLLLLALICALSLSAQEYASESDMIKGANDLFEEEQFLKAMPLYSQLVSLYPKNTEYNFKYGACLIHGDRDKGKSLKFLKYAAGRPDVDPLAFYFLGRAYHLNYDFGAAIRTYKKFQEKGGSKEAEKRQVPHLIEMCNNGQNLLTDIKELVVIDKQEIKDSDFFRLYELGEIGGKIIVKPDQFRSKLDLKTKETSLIHLSPNARVLYYSSYGESKGQGRDIYRVRKSDNGEWGTPENLGAPINTPYDEDYPFMHPDGTLYFCSKGHNSMGGYDIFKSRYNESTGTWSAPENLDFAISSTSEDLLFISDLSNRIAYFASNRNAIDGKLIVYRAQISRRAPSYAVIEGAFISEDRPEFKSAKVTVIDPANNEKIGTYQTDPKTGEYKIPLPQHGKTYKFVVETDPDAPIHTGNVMVPAQEDLVALKQELRLVNQSDNEKLLIKNLFDESTSNEVDRDTRLQLIRQAADLEVNATEEEVLAQLQEGTDHSGGTSQNTGAGPELIRQESDAGIVQKMEGFSNTVDEQLNVVEADIQKSEKQANYGMQLALEKAKKADEIYEQLEADISEYEKDKANASQELIDRINQQLEEVYPLSSEAIVAFELASSLSNEVKEKKDDLNSLKQIRKDLDALDQGDGKAVGEFLVDNTEKVDNIRNTNSALSIASSRNQEILEEKTAQYDKVNDYVSGLEQEIGDVEAEILRLRAEASKTKNKKSKQSTTEQADAMEVDLEDLRFEYNKRSEKRDQLAREVNNLKNDNQVIEAYVSKISNGTSNTAALSTEDEQALRSNIEFFREQRMLEGIIGPETLASTDETSTSGALVADEEGVYPAMQNGQRTDYTTQYDVEVATAKEIEDESERSETLTRLYSNWQTTVKQDIAFQEQTLSETEDETERLVIEERIGLLKEKVLDLDGKIEEASSSDFADVAIDDAAGGVEGQGSGVETSEDTDRKRGKRDKPAKNNDDKGKQKQKAVEPPQLQLAVSAAYVAPSVSGKKEVDYAGAYQKQLAEVQEENADRPQEINSIEESLIHLNWAKSLNEDIAKKEMSARLGGAEEKASLEALKKEREVHLDKASKHFTAQRIDEYVYNNPTEEVENKFSVTEGGEVFDYQQAYTDKRNEIALRNVSGMEKTVALEELYANWTETVTEEMLYVNAQLQVTENEQEKQVLRQRITELEGQRQQLANETAELQVYNDERSGDPGSTPETSGIVVKEELFDENGAFVDYEHKYQGQQLQLENQGDANKMNGLVRVNDKWVDAIDEELAFRQQQVQLAVRDDERVAIQSRIDELQRTKAYRSKEAEEARSLQAIIDEWVGDSNEKEQLLASGFVNAISSSLPEYESGEAKVEVEKIKQRLDEISTLHAQRRVAMEQEQQEVGDRATVEQYDAQLASQWNTLLNQYAVLNAAEHNTNNELMDNYIEQSGGETSVDADAMSRWKQAEVDYQKAGALRKSAAEMTSPHVREMAIQQAIVMEYRAIRSQAEVMDQLGIKAEGELAFLNTTPNGGATPDPGQSGDEGDDSANTVVTPPAQNVTTETGNTTGEVAGGNADNNVNESTGERDVAVFESREDTPTTIENSIPSETTPVETRPSLADSQPKPKVKMSRRRYEALVITPEFKNYETAAEEVSTKEAEVSDFEKLLAEAMAALTEAENELAQKREAAANAKKKKDRKRLTKEAEVLELSMAAKQKTRDSLQTETNDRKEALAESEKAAEEVLAQTDPQKRREIEAIVLGQQSGNVEDLISEESAPLAVDLSDNGDGVIAEVSAEDLGSVQLDEMPEELEQDVFVKANTTTTSAYGASKPIPIDRETPKGLVFKVQVGAFRNPIPQDLFKGFAPIHGERTASGITRYTAGVFKDFRNANRAKNEIRQLGYSDAFVVAFYDGKRISFSELRNLGDDDALLAGGNASTNTNTTTTTPQRTTPPPRQEITTPDRPRVNPDIASQTRSVEQIEGLFFTVQVGVYTNTVLPRRLNNIPELNSEVAPDGNIRYTSGVFENLFQAQERRSNVAAQGISDAFITAYYNGNRISVGEALRILREQ